MIGIDTNVLLRQTLEDDADQSPRAIAFIDSAERLADPVLVNPIVLIEFVWTLMRRQRFDKAQVLALIDVMIASPHIVFSDEEAVTAAVDAWRHGPAGLQDYLIGSLNRRAGARTTLTFDSRAARHPDFTPMPV
ncbi:PIN domain-containing protein [Methylobacterium oryzisoli]|uniref:PIN domain-containing protein n=1 Tax=Methylobacterium oryzisoli TaxID=3385502 RepID=UPI003891B91C